MKSIVGLLLASLLATAEPADDTEPVDRPARLTPRVPQTEAEADRVHAAALYAHGRLLVQRNQTPAGLRRLQRAWRYDPRPTSIAAEIVPLALELERDGEAVVYAALNAENEQADSAAALRLATLAADRRDWPRAARLYQQAIRAQQAATAPDFTQVLMQMELGRIQFLLGHSEAAARSLNVVRQALEDPAKFGLSEPLRHLLLDKPEQTYALLAEVFFAAGQWDYATAMYGKLNAAQPDEALLEFHLARVATAREQYAQALRRLDKCLAANLTSVDSDLYDLLEECLRHTEPDAEAAQAALVKRLESGHAQFPQNRPLATRLAEMLLQQRRFSQARQLFQQLADAEADSDVFAGWLASLREQTDDRLLLHGLAKTALELHSFAAVESATKPIAQDQERLARLVALLPPDAADAPSDGEPGAALALGLLAIAAGQFDLADQCLGRAAREAKPGKAVVLPLWGLEMLVADQPARAAHALRQAVDEHVRPESGRVYAYHLVGALELAGQTDEALEAGRRALADLPPDSRSPLLEGRLAWVLVHARRHREAEAAYRQLLRDFDDDFASDAAREAVRQARLALSNLAVSQHDSAGAVEWLEQILDENPDDAEAQNDLAYLWAERSQHLKRALALSRRAVAAEPDNVSYRDTLGWVLYRLNRFSEALPELQAACQNERPNAVILDHLGDCLQRLDRSADARQAWQRALAASEGREPDEVERRAALQRKLERTVPP